jgi:protocatechuate 3,4-dioxygenase beta subunit
MKHRPIVPVRALPRALLDRRELLRHTAVGLAAWPLVHLACGADPLNSGLDGGLDAGTAADSGAEDLGLADSGEQDSGTTPDSGAEPDSGEPDSGEPTDAGVIVGWAGGGTVSMTGKANYPDPFTESLSNCALVTTTTAGPCTTATDLLREDVSEGWSGLPVRLVLKVVDTQCNPLSGSRVKIWHTNIVGSYSGETPSNNFCLLDQAYRTSDFFRGVQTTNAEGEVYFDTCFPGWYPGRAIHIHFQILNGNTSQRVSQLFFPEDLTTDIFANHPEYEGYGQPDTVFSNDGVMAAIPGAERARHILAVERMNDGAMLASKVVTVVEG